MSDDNPHHDSVMREAKRRAEVAQRLIDSAKTETELMGKDNVELARLMKEHVMADMDMTSPEFVLLDVIAERLENL